MTKSTIFIFILVFLKLFMQSYNINSEYYLYFTNWITLSNCHFRFLTWSWFLITRWNIPIISWFHSRNIIFNCQRINSFNLIARFAPLNFDFPLWWCRLLLEAVPHSRLVSWYLPRVILYCPGFFIWN